MSPMISCALFVPGVGRSCRDRSLEFLRVLAKRCRCLKAEFLGGVSIQQIGLEDAVLHDDGLAAGHAFESKGLVPKPPGMVPSSTTLMLSPAIFSFSFPVRNEAPR